MFRTFLIAGLVVVALSAGLTTVAHACACCAEPGSRYEGRAEFGSDTFEAQTIGQLQPDGNATLYTTTADWEEQIRGIDNPDKSDRYTVELERDDKTWAFKFEDDKGNTGIVVVRRPEFIDTFSVDPTPGDESNTSPVRLYKELRITGALHGIGMFALRTRGQPYATVIFHGLGNGCAQAEQFTHWTLDVNGPGARYRFFGKLAASK